MTPRQQAYLEYLRSPAWWDVREAVIARDVRCVVCKGRRRLQAHHVFYRERFEDTKPEDCITLCRACHKAHHGIGQESQEPINHKIVPLRQPAVPERTFENYRQAEQARSRREITRSEFKKWRRFFGKGKVKQPRITKRQRKLAELARRKEREREHKERLMKIYPMADWSAQRWRNVTGRKRWINRGTSSN